MELAVRSQVLAIYSKQKRAVSLWIAGFTRKEIIYHGTGRCGIQKKEAQKGKKEGPISCCSPLYSGRCGEMLFFVSIRSLWNRDVSYKGSEAEIS